MERARSASKIGLPLIIVTAIGGAAAHADGWVGKGEAGLLISRGNADSTSANAKLDISREVGDWKNSFFLGGLYGKNAAFSTAQRIEGRWETDQKITDRLFWFGALRGENDRFSGFSYQATVSTGLGYKWFDTETTKLATTLGVGYRRLRPETLVQDPDGQVTDRIKGEATGNAVGSFGLDFLHVLTKTTKILDKALIESGSDNTAAQNDLALQVSISDALALSVGYGVRYNTAPPGATKKLDQLTTLNLVYNIK